MASASPRPLLRVGLTGGIAAGKTTVAEMFRKRGALVVDADRVVHGLMQPGRPVHAAIVERFGREVTDGRGAIDRKRLGDAVFRDDEARRALEAIVHPAVRREAWRRFDERAATRAGAPIVMLDAALLVETGQWRAFDRVAVVHCRRDTQLERIRRRDGLEGADAEARLASQLPTEAKLAVADYRVDTDGDLDRTERQVEAIWQRLLHDHRRRFGSLP